MKKTRLRRGAVIFLAALIALTVIALVATEYAGISTTAIAQNKTQKASPTPAADTPFLTQVMENALPNSTESSFLETFEIVQRLLLAVLLSGILAFRPRKNVPLFRRSLFVSQTQILLAVVAAALMMIVGDNAARAFAIFAAVSLVRFRTNIRDPKEVTVLLISLSLGLATGVGRWDLGIALCLFALALLWLLEFNESAQSFRSMELTIKTRDPEKSQEILRKIFRRLKIDSEVREIVPVDEEQPLGSIKYYLNLRLNLTTDKLSDRILAADPENTEGIQWSKTKSAADIYQ